MFIHRAGLDRREDVVSQKLEPQVFDNHFARAGFVSLLDDRVEVVTLADVSDESDHVAVIVFLQPRNDDGGVQPSGISKDNFFTHWYSSAGSGEHRLPAAKP